MWGDAGLQESSSRRYCQYELFRAEGEREFTYYKPNTQSPDSIPGSRAELKQGQGQREGTAEDYL